MAPGWFPTTLTVFLVSLRTCTYAGEGSAVRPAGPASQHIPGTKPFLPLCWVHPSPSSAEQGAHCGGEGRAGVQILESRVKGQVIVVCA